jgi:hypothetical protein
MSWVAIFIQQISNKNRHYNNRDNDKIVIGGVNCNQQTLYSLLSKIKDKLKLLNVSGRFFLDWDRMIQMSWIANFIRQISNKNKLDNNSETNDKL